MEKKKIRNIIFDIDTILDTRLPIIYILDSNIAGEIVQSGAYQARRKDNFKEISNDIFMPLYRKRNKRILELAAPTAMLNMIRAHYGDVVTEQIKSDQPEEKAFLYVNIYPYSFNATELDNVKFIISKVIPKTDIRFVSMSNTELNPVWLKENVGYIFKYDGLEWLELHVGNGNLINTPLMDIHLFAAAIVNGNIPSKKIDAQLYENMISVGQTVIDLTLVHLKEFSIVTK